MIIVQYSKQVKLKYQPEIKLNILLMIKVMEMLIKNNKIKKIPILILRI